MNRKIETAAAKRTRGGRKGFGRALLSSWLLESRNLIFSGRFLVVTILSLFLVIFYTDGVLDFAKDYQLSVSPVVLPFFFSDEVFGNLALMVLIFLMSAFPFRDNLQRGIRMKAGNSCYGLAQILTMITAAFCWMVEMQILFVLRIGGRCLMRGWGRVWGAFASGQAAMQNYRSDLNININIILFMEPYQALILSLFLSLSVAVIFGEIVFLVDALTGQAIGEIFLSLYLFGFVSIAVLGSEVFKRTVGRFDPAAWCDISKYLLHDGTLGKTLMVMGAFFALLTVADYQLIKRKIVSE